MSGDPADDPLGDPAADELHRTRAARDAAWAAQRGRLARVRADLAARGPGARIAGKLRADARELAGEGLAVAAESRGIIAAAIAALLVWSLRRPLLARLRGAGARAGAERQAGTAE